MTYGNINLCIKIMGNSIQVYLYSAFQDGNLYKKCSIIFYIIFSNSVSVVTSQVDVQMAEMY